MAVVLLLGLLVFLAYTDGDAGGGGRVEAVLAKVERDREREEGLKPVAWDRPAATLEMNSWDMAPLASLHRASAPSASPSSSNGIESRATEPSRHSGPTRRPTTNQTKQRPPEAGARGKREWAN